MESEEDEIIEEKVHLQLQVEEMEEEEEEYELEEGVEEGEDDTEFVDDPTYEAKPSRRPRRQKSLEENNACNLCQRMFKTPAVSGF